MGDERLITRRDLFKKTLMVGAAAAGAGYLLSACGDDDGGGELTCTDTSGLSDQETQQRQAQEYVDASPNPQETCANCRFYQAPQESGCGTCQVIKGPVHPQGYCKLWAAQEGAGG